ncbi:MAG: hypothetical protein ACJ8F7_03635 [Gemmataceae bacterium]
MTIEDRVRKIVPTLLEKTKAGEVRWRTKSTTMFSVRLGNSFLALDLISPPTEPDRLAVSLLNSVEQEAGRWEVGEGSRDWQVLQELYGYARANARGLDKVLEDIERAMSPVGANGRETAAEHPDRNDDIPL